MPLSTPALLQMKRRFRRRSTRALIVVALLAFVLLARLGLDFLGPSRPDDPDIPLREGSARVVRVVDGDTLILQQSSSTAQDADRTGPREYRVRLIGIDTPETVKPNHPVEPWGPEATKFAEQFLAGAEVRVRLDKRRLDKYKRSLAYVYVNDRMLNEELVRAGLARVVSYPGDSESIARQLSQAADEAISARVGMWSETAPRP